MVVVENRDRHVGTGLAIDDNDDWDRCTWVGIDGIIVIPRSETRLNTDHDDAISIKLR